MQLGRGVDVARIGRARPRSTATGDAAHSPQSRALRLPSSGVEVARGCAATGAPIRGDRSGTRPRRRRPCCSRRRADRGSRGRAARRAARRYRGRCRARSRGASAKSTPSPTIAAWWHTASTPSTRARRDRRDRRRSPQMPLGARVEVVGDAVVGAGMQPVEHPDVVAGVEQLLDDERADEAGAAGDEDHHGLRTRVCTPMVNATCDGQPPRRVATDCERRTGGEHPHRERQPDPFDLALRHPAERGERRSPPARRRRRSQRRRSRRRASATAIAGPSAMARHARFTSRNTTYGRRDATPA